MNDDRPATARVPDRTDPREDPARMQETDPLAGASDDPRVDPTPDGHQTRDEP